MVKMASYCDIMGRMNKQYRLRDPMQRFYDKVNVLDNGCWQWLGYKNGRTGYAQFHVRTTPFLAHRFAYMIFKGALIKGLAIDHLCSNRLCVNPEHLEQVTYQENVLRSSGIAAINSRKTSCKNGHLYSKNNLYTCPRGRRECRQCRKAALTRYELRRKLSPAL